ncbi:hypothetical protein [Chamaesiphon sp.]|uniref:hypothetical protein n=1 Tax=Chamaesiphon sp. TaxID=2814140 RepID=UPI003593305D
MYKKLSLLLSLAYVGSIHSPIAPAAQSQPLVKPPPLTIVMQAQTVEIHHDWNGYSDITPVLRHYKLRVEHQKLVGNAHIAIGGYGAAGVHQQQTTRIAIPAAVTTKFLAMLSKTPLQVGTYQPQIVRTDDYPSIEIRLKRDRQTVIFSSQSQGNNYVPWKVRIVQANTTTAYITNSPLPAQALQLLAPYVDRHGIEKIIQRRRIPK